jgi:hypothetical protein
MCMLLTPFEMSKGSCKTALLLNLVVKRRLSLLDVPSYAFAENPPLYLTLRRMTSFSAGPRGHRASLLPSSEHGPDNRHAPGRAGRVPDHSGAMHVSRRDESTWNGLS